MRSAIIVIIGAFGLIATPLLGQAPEPHPGWPVFGSSKRLSLADMNGDGTLEIIAGDAFDANILLENGNSLEGWPSTAGGGIGSPPCVGDIDGDGSPDLVFWGPGSTLAALSADGELKSGWPITIVGEDGFSSGLALGDLNGDGALEVITHSMPTFSLLATVYAYDGLGEPLPGWPVEIDAATAPYSNGPYEDMVVTGLAVGDLEFDGSYEVVLSTRYFYPFSAASEGATYVIDGDGNIRDGWPVVPPSIPGSGGLPIPPFSGMYRPAVIDLDGDHVCEIIGTSANGIWVYESDGTIEPNFTAAGSFPGYNARHPSCGDLDGDGIPEIVVPATSLHIYDADHQLLASTAGSYEKFEGAAIGDVNGDGDKEIAVFSTEDTSDQGSPSNAEFYLHLYDQDLVELEGWPLLVSELGAVSVQNPVALLGDLDADGDMEIVYEAGFSIHVWDQPNPGEGPAVVDWGMFGHDATAGFFYHQGNLPTPVFLRGDANRDGLLQLSDAIVLCRYLFLGDSNDCAAQLDFDANGEVMLPDAIGLLSFQFLEGAPPPEPFPLCGTRPVGDTLPCIRYLCPTE